MGFGPWVSIRDRQTAVDPEPRRGGALPALDRATGGRSRRPDHERCGAGGAHGISAAGRRAEPPGSGNGPSRARAGDGVPRFGGCHCRPRNRRWRGSEFRRRPSRPISERRSRSPDPATRAPDAERSSGKRRGCAIGYLRLAESEPRERGRARANGGGQELLQYPAARACGGRTRRGPIVGKPTRAPWAALRHRPDRE